MKSKNFCGIFATLFVTTTIILLASCSQDDDNYDSDMYTLAELGTRLGDPTEGGDLFNLYEKNTHIPGDRDCCGLYALTARYIDMNGRAAFDGTSIYPAKNAEKFYYEIKSYVMSHPELQWTPDSSAMPLTTIMALAKKFKVDGKPLFGELKLLSSLEEVQEYLSEKNNRNKVKAVVMRERKDGGKEHIAFVTSVDKNSIAFKGYNYVIDNYDGGKVYFNSVVDKNGNLREGKDCNNQPYEIIGVLLK